MKFIGKRYSLYTKDILQICCRTVKFLWKSKCCSESGSGSWFYFGFQNQTYISYIEDTHQILFASANSFESCVHIESPCTFSQTDRQTDRQTDSHADRQTDRRKFFLFVFSSKTYKTWTFVKRREFFFHSCDYNTLSFYLHTPYVMRK